MWATGLVFVCCILAWNVGDCSVPGRIFTEADAVIAQPKERAVLSCYVMGERITGLTWRKAGQFFKISPTNVWWNNKTHTTVELEFAKVTPDDAGEYECRIESSDGLALATTKLEVKNFADIPVEVRAIGTNDIYIIWNYKNIIGEYSYTHVRVTNMYKESGTNEWHQAGRILDSSTDWNIGYYVLKNLKNHTLYQIKIVFEIRERRSDALRKIFGYSKWTTTFEKDVNYVPTVEISDKTVDTVTIEWSQPPAELRRFFDGYLISSVGFSDKIKKSFNWWKYFDTTHRTILYIPPSSSYALTVRACFSDFCPDRHASVVMKGVMNNDTAVTKVPHETLRSEFEKVKASLRVHVNPNAENTTAGSDASFNCSVTVRGLGGWWSREGESVTFSNNADDEKDSTILVGDAQGGENRDYLCTAKMSNDPHTGGAMRVTLIPPTEIITNEVETVYAKPREPTALSCDISASQLNVLAWRKVSNGSIGSSSPQCPSRLFYTESNMRYELDCANPSESDAGDYECEAINNRLRRIANSIRLEVSEQSPLQLNATVIGSRLVHLSWYDITFQGDAHLIRSAEIGSSEWKDEFSVQVEDGKNNYNGYVVRQLTPKTSYWFKIIVISKGGRLASTYSRWITSTGEDLVYFPNITVTSKTTKSINIEWPMPPEKLRAHIKVYRISVNYTYYGSGIVDFKNTTENHYIVEELHPSTSYDLEVKACFSVSSTDCYSSDVKRGVFTKSTG